MLGYNEKGTDLFYSMIDAVPVVTASFYALRFAGWPTLRR
jgi:hypothetical protein